LDPARGRRRSNRRHVETFDRHLSPGTGLIGCEPEEPGALDASPEAAPPTDSAAADAPSDDAPAADAGPALPVPGSPLPGHVRELIQGHVERRDFMGVMLIDLPSRPGLTGTGRAANFRATSCRTPRLPGNGPGRVPVAIATRPIAGLSL
jgi:hypothetical protein